MEPTPDEHLRAYKQEPGRSREEFGTMAARILPELRAPVDNLLAMASLLALTGLSEDQLRYLRTIEASAHTLQTLLVRLLEEAKAGETPAERIIFSPAAPAPPAPQTTPDSPPLRILIAEDHPINQVVLAEQLTGLGHECLTVGNGVEALKAIRQSPWDAILLDCNMPVMDGYQTVEAIRREEAGTGRHLWVVAVTANALEGERNACLRAGMDDFLSKPLRGRELAAMLARIPRAPASGPPGAKPALNVSALDSLASSKSATGENLLEKMSKLFTESGMQLIGQMEQGLQNDNLVEAIRAAHKMAGGCSYFGAQTLYELCTNFEQAGKKEDRAALRDLAPRIRQEYGRVEAALHARSPMP